MLESGLVGSATFFLPGSAKICGPTYSDQREKNMKQKLFTLETKIETD